MGIRRRVFIEVIGAIGDTLAIENALNLKGHTSISCCLLCTFRRKPLKTICLHIFNISIIASNLSYIARERECNPYSFVTSRSMKFDVMVTRIQDKQSTYFYSDYPMP